MTLREYNLKVQGYTRVQHSEDSRMRLLAFIYAKPHLKDQKISVYDFMPLAGDPSPEEIKRIEAENLERENQKAREFKNELLKRFGYGGV